MTTTQFDEIYEVIADLEDLNDEDLISVRGVMLERLNRVIENNK